MKNDTIALTGYTDKPGNDDMLGMDVRCAGIADFVSTCSTPMTVAIKGDWGTGKTTAMNLILHKLNSGPKQAYSVWFNAWQFSVFGGGESLIFDLLSMLLDKLKELACEGAPPADREKRVQNATSILTKGVLSAGHAFLKQQTEWIFDTIEELGGLVGGEQRPRAEAPESMTHYVSTLRDEVQYYINKLLEKDPDHDRIYIFVDDLDRLDPKFAVELLEGLKILADYDNCVFILAVDQEVVEQGLMTRYGTELDKEKARKFFDKIIQVPFSLPVDSYDMGAFLSELLKEKNKGEIEGYVGLLEAFGEKNPRTIKRSLNLLQLYDCIDRASRNTREAVGQTDKLRRYALLLLQLESYDTNVEVLDIIRRSHTSGSEYNFSQIGSELRELTESFDDSSAMINKRGLSCVLDLFFKEPGEEDGVRSFVSSLLQTQEIVGDNNDWNADVARLRVTRKLFDFLDSKLNAGFTSSEDWSELRESFRKDDRELIGSGFHIHLRVQSGERTILLSRDKNGYPNLSVFGVNEEVGLEGIRDRFFLGKREKSEYNKYCFFYASGQDRLTLAGIRFVSEDVLDRFIANCGIGRDLSLLS